MSIKEELRKEFYEELCGVVLKITNTTLGGHNKPYLETQAAVDAVGLEFADRWIERLSHPAEELPVIV